MFLRFQGTEFGRKAHERAVEGTRESLEKYGVFDVGSCIGFRRKNCSQKSPCCGLVFLYAWMGLHRYNLLEGTNLDISHVKRYNMTLTLAASYYITLVAMDPSSGKLVHFQTNVNEECCGKFALTSFIARPRRGPKATDSSGRRFCPMGSLPEFPQENPFENENRFYLVDESELEDNDWIRLYLELSVARSDWTSKDHDLSHLKIVNVAIETMEPPSESSLTAKNATVYIRYIDSCVARCGQKFDRIAVVRRRFNERTGCFILDGWNQSSEIIPEKQSSEIIPEKQSSEIIPEKQSSEIIPKKDTSLSSKLLSRRLIRRLIRKSRRTWRGRCAYTNDGVGLAHRLCKTRSIESAIRKYTQKGYDSDCETPESDCETSVTAFKRSQAMADI